MNLVIVSGYFNPLHTGHLDYLEGASRLGDYLIVIVNNDEQVRIKGSIPFLSLKDRLRIVQALTCVGRSVASIDTDGSVVKTIEELAKLWKQAGSDGTATQISEDGIIFANGGDRNSNDIPEYSLCEKYGIQMAFNIGGGKTQSSSGLIKKVKQ